MKKWKLPTLGLLALAWVTPALADTKPSQDVAEPETTDDEIIVEEVEVDPIDVLKERQARVQAVFKKVSPAIVALEPAGRKQGSGSGVIVSPEGLVLSAGHVTEATGKEVLIHLADGREMPGKSLGANMNRDAAMVQILAAEGTVFPYVEMAEADTALLGDWVVALGHPGGFDPTRPAPLRVGRVTQKQSDRLLVTDCTLSGGDSGGALFDLDGRLIGIHSSIAQSFSHNMHVAIAVFHKHWDRLQEGDNWGELTTLFDEPLPGYESQVDRSKHRAVLGAELDDRSRNGVLARRVRPDFPADKAGMRSGDVIISFDAKDVSDKPALLAMIKDYDPGDEVPMVVRRRGREVELTITLGDRNKLLPQR